MAVIVKAAAESLGKSIPENFSILTFDTPLSFTGVPPITHLFQDEYSVGKEAVHALHRIITFNDQERNHRASRKTDAQVLSADILVPAKLVVGSSTGPISHNIG